MKEYLCSHCGYAYEPSEGDWYQHVPPNTAFGDLLDSWTCPDCHAPKRVFKRQTQKRTAHGRQKEMKNITDTGGQSEGMGEERVWNFFPVY